MATVKIYSDGSDWFSNLDDLKDYIENECGAEVTYMNREIVCFVEDDDKEYIAYLAGTERTIYIDRIEEV